MGVLVKKGGWRVGGRVDERTKKQEERGE